MFEGRSSAPSLSGLNALIADGDEGTLTFGISVPPLSLYPVRPSDEPFLYLTFASTRTAEMALTGWNADQQEAFLRMQYEAQRRSYLLQLPDAEYWVIRRHETAVGRLILDRKPEEIHIVDIAILAEFRGQGIGSTLMQAIMMDASEGAKAVRLHVERCNPALGWYERLGFSVVNSGPVYLEMVWQPCSEASGSREARGSAAEAEVGSGVCRSI